MNDVNTRICIVENEYLIALDIERAITENFDVSTDIVDPSNATEAVASGAYAILVIDADIKSMPVEDVLSQADAISIPYVLTTVASELPRQLTENAKAVVDKPFADETLLKACRPLIG